MIQHDKFRLKPWYNSFWSNNPDAFGECSTETERLIVATRDALVNSGVVYPKVIDVASGSGRYSILLESVGFDVTAIDLSDVACGILRQKTKVQNYNTKIICDDFVTSSELASESFDLVFSSGLLEELQQDKQSVAIEKMKSLVSSTGFILIKYCLEIMNRGIQVENGFVESFFVLDEWNILYKVEDKEMRYYPQGVTGEDQIRTGLLYVQRIK